MALDVENFGKPFVRNQFYDDLYYILPSNPLKLPIQQYIQCQAFQLILVESAYSWVPNRGRVWNNHIGWTFTLKRINVGCGINVLGGNFPKMLIVGDGMFPFNV